MPASTSVTARDTSWNTRSTANIAEKNLSSADDSISNADSSSVSGASATERSGSGNGSGTSSDGISVTSNETSNTTSNSSVSSSSAPTRASGTKRSSTSGSGGEHTKRRLAYAPRACDSCRKRKGKCDGCRPCEYCMNRGQTCMYSLTQSDWQGILGSAESSQVRRTAEASAWIPEINMSHVGNMITELQTKLDNLTALIQQNGGGDQASQLSGARTVGGLASSGRDSGTQESIIDHATMSSGAVQNNLLRSHENSDSVGRASACSHNSSGGRSSRPSLQFCGPMSPEFSLNMARSKVCNQNSPKRRPSKPSLASIDEDESDNGENGDAHDLTSSSSSNGTLHSTSCGTVAQTLTSSRISRLELPLCMTDQEAVRLLGVYQEVAGDLHPILDNAEVLRQVNTWYSQHNHKESNNETNRDNQNCEEDEIIILLLICIALFAEETPKESETGKTIYDSIAHVVNMKLTSPATNIKHAILALSAGQLHFFRGSPRMAWRMCGLAGSMFMELGLHTKEVSQHVLETEQEQRQAATIICTILLLDRQWSSATGLPAHFSESMFKQDLQTALQNPYLKAMMPFLSISDKIEEMISRVIHGQPYEDDDAFELINFQIEQWRRHVVGQYSDSLLQEGGFSYSRSVPSWAILLNLRANSVKGILLRPFFFSSTRQPAKDRKIKPALELVSNTIGTLVSLDQNSDIYRKQHPYFQHLLAGSCALLALVVIYMAQNQGGSISDMPEEYLNSIKTSYSHALALARAYAGSVRASRRLLRLLMLLRNPLIKLVLLPADYMPCEAAPNGDAAEKATGQSWSDILSMSANLNVSGPAPLATSYSTNDADLFAFGAIGHDHLLDNLPQYMNNRSMPSYSGENGDITGIGGNGSQFLTPWSFPGTVDMFSWATF